MRKWLIRLAPVVVPLVMKQIRKRRSTTGPR